MPFRTGPLLPVSRMPLVALLVGLGAWGCGDGGSPTEVDPPPPPPPPPPSIASITVTLAGGGIEVGQTLSPTAEARSQDGTLLTAAFTWNSTNPAVATVSSAGLVVGRTKGTTTIQASSGGVTGSAELTVAPMDLTEFVASVRAARGLPAMGGAIVTRDGLVGIGVAGDRRFGAGPPVTLDDRWHIGSNLKAITAGLAAVAVTRGDLSWSRTVADAFPELDATMRDDYRNVTLEALLANQGGIRNDPPGGTYAGATARAQREAMVEWALTAPPIGAVGGYYYSNPGFVIAGAMIERAMGGDFEALLQTEWLGSLGVTSLGWGPTTNAGGTDQPVGHRPEGAGWLPCEACDNPPGLSAAGRAHMGLGDWVWITRELLRADAGESELISASNGRALFTGLSQITGPESLYSLGWIMTNRAWGGRTATHSGSNVSNHSVAWLGLDTGVAFIVVTNAARPAPDGTAAAMEEVVSGLLGRWQGLP